MKKRDIFIVFVALAAALVLVFAQFHGDAVETLSWGLSYPNPGQPPVGNDKQSTLAGYHAFYLGDTSQKVLYLTFDAGYENGHTAKILDVLQEQQVSAAFFLVGSYIEKNPDLVRRMASEGHIVGNHTMHHPDMSVQSEEAFTRELTDLEALYLQTTGETLPKFYRPPQGVYNQKSLERAKSLGYTTVFWSLAYADWKNDAQPTREQAFAKLIPRLHNGAVVLLHSTSATNARILEEFITTCKAQGYRFASLTELTMDN